MPSQTILHRYSIIHVSCTNAAIRSIGLRFQPISRFGQGLLSALWLKNARIIEKKERSGLQSACDELIDKGAIITGE